MRSSTFTLGVVALFFAVAALGSSCSVQTIEPEPKSNVGGGGEGGGGEGGGGEGGGGEGGGGASTGPLVTVESVDASIEVGGDTAVTVNLENVPVSAQHMYTSETEYFTLVASSEDGAAALMFNAIDAQPDAMRLDWETVGEEAYAPTMITGLVPGTVTLAMGQVTDSPIAFGEAYTGSSDVTVSVTAATGTKCSDFSGTWLMNVSKVDSSCPPELDWNSTITITQTDCSTSTTDIKDIPDPVSGSASGFTITIGPGDFEEGGGTTTATYVMAAVDDPPTEMVGVERWSWAPTGGDPSCVNGTAVLHATKP
jgi:hypothetical protein